MGYEKIFNNPIEEERVILIKKDISCNVLIEHLEETLKKQQFIRIKKQKTINVLEAQYKSGIKYGMLKIKIQDVFGQKRLYLKATSDNNFFTEIFNINTCEYIINKFLENINLKYSKI